MHIYECNTASRCLLHLLRSKEFHILKQIPMPDYITKRISLTHATLIVITDLHFKIFYTYLHNINYDIMFNL